MDDDIIQLSARLQLADHELNIDNAVHPIEFALIRSGGDDVTMTTGVRVIVTGSEKPDLNFTISLKDNITSITSGYVLLRETCDFALFVCANVLILTIRSKSAKI